MNLGPFATARERLDVDFINLRNLPGVRVQLLYNGTNNFMNQDLYEGFDQAYLHKDAFTKFAQACDLLGKRHPGFAFIVYDALRPRSVQKRMYGFVAGSQYKDYVAEPTRGSLHNFGMAIDLSLLDGNGNPLDMGTAFDDFADLAQPQLEEKFLAEKKLTRIQFENRLQLRSIMEATGFQQLPHEWWHYNALDAQHVRANYKIVE